MSCHTDGSFGSNASPKGSQFRFFRVIKGGVLSLTGAPLPSTRSPPPAGAAGRGAARPQQGEPAPAGKVVKQLPQRKSGFFPRIWRPPSRPGGFFSCPGNSAAGRRISRRGGRRDDAGRPRRRASAQRRPRTRGSGAAPEGRGHPAARHGGGHAPFHADHACTRASAHKGVASARSSTCARSFFYSHRSTLAEVTESCPRAAEVAAAGGPRGDEDGRGCASRRRRQALGARGGTGGGSGAPLLPSRPRPGLRERSGRRAGWGACAASGSGGSAGRRAAAA